VSKPLLRVIIDPPHLLERETHLVFQLAKLLRWSQTVRVTQQVFFYEKAVPVID
jgi:hypothetical protein